MEEFFSMGEEYSYIFWWEKIKTKEGCRDFKILVK